MWVLAVCVGVLFHEMGHATAMRAYGFFPWITLYGMGGLASYQPSAYSPRGNRSLMQIIICAAGPGAGFLLAALILMSVRLAGYRIAVGLVGGLPYAAFEQLHPIAFHLFLRDLLWVCIYWGLLNLLPILPLDGGQIAREVLTALNPRDGVRQALILSIVVGGLMIVLGLFRWDDKFLALLFGFMTYSNYMTLQAYRGGGLW
jgi:Zn-dependent protease